jgi:molecular chaperone GrpE
MAEEQQDAEEAREDAATESPPLDSDLEAALADAERKAEDNRNDYLRIAAELENSRKRMQRDLAQAQKFAIDKFAIELLPVKDSLEMGLSAAGDDAKALREGVEMTLKQLTDALAKHGITEVDPAGERFNPEFHEAMAMQPSDEAEPDTVLTVIQKGYVLNGRLLRPARVIVARAAGEDG